MLLVTIVDCALGHLPSPSIESCILDCQLHIHVFILRFLFFNAWCMHTRVTVVCYQSTACLRRLCSKDFQLRDFTIKLSFTNYRFCYMYQQCQPFFGSPLRILYVTSLAQPRAYLLIGEVLLIGVVLLIV